MLLGDLGADVIKVERPGSGDESRTWGPPFDSEGRSAYFLSINRNKLGLAADFDVEGDRALLRQLVAEADIVVDNFRPGVLAKRGFSPERLCADRPELIWCTITGFGPDNERPGYDFVAQAECGWMWITGEPNGEPMKVGVALADSARAALVNVAQNALVSGEEARRWGNAHPNLVPYQLFSAADRAIVIAVGSDAQWIACARAVGLTDLADDAALAINSGRLAQRRRIVEAFTQRLATASAAHWREKLDAAGVPNGVVMTVLETLRGTRSSALMGMPSSVGGNIRRPPPALDEHGSLIRERGWGVFDVRLLP
jgi:crotonobetainyl-CoA:carnitine CoA-transferase CaiB-like acyl-CoA transferase